MGAGALRVALTALARAGRAGCAAAASDRLRLQQTTGRARNAAYPVRNVCPGRTAPQRSAARPGPVVCVVGAAPPSIGFSRFARGVVCDGATALAGQGCNTANLRCNLRCNLGPRSGRRDARPAPVRRACARAARRAQGRRDAGKSHRNRNRIAITSHRIASHRCSAGSSAARRWDGVGGVGPPIGGPRVGLGVCVVAGERAVPFCQAEPSRPN